MNSVTHVDQMNCLARYWDNVSMDRPNVILNSWKL